jgi:uncharacterized NAD-dependent epimerase/dehydratase family protein
MVEHLFRASNVNAVASHGGLKAGARPTAPAGSPTASRGSAFAAVVLDVVAGAPQPR